MNVLNDARTIRMIITRRGIDKFRTWAVGQRRITEIRVESTPGMGAMVPWFAVYRGDDVAWRVNGIDVAEVFYAARTEEASE